MITGDNLGQLVRYYCNGWHVGTLAEFEKKKGVAVIKTPISGQRKKRVPAEDCEVYQEEKCQQVIQRS
jgi:hypothetical protein